MNFFDMKEYILPLRSDYGKKWNKRQNRKQDILNCIRDGDCNRLEEILNKTKPYNREETQYFDELEFSEYNQEILQGYFDSLFSRQAGPSNEENIIRVHMKPFCGNMDFYVDIERTYCKDITNMNYIPELNIINEENGKAKICKFICKTCVYLNQEKSYITCYFDYL